MHKCIQVYTPFSDEYHALGTVHYSLVTDFRLTNVLHAFGAALCIALAGITYYWKYKLLIKITQLLT